MRICHALRADEDAAPAVRLAGLNTREVAEVAAEDGHASAHQADAWRESLYALGATRLRGDMSATRVMVSDAEQASNPALPLFFGFRGP